MDRRPDASMSDTDLDRLLAEALAVEPSPEFRAHVHARVALQRPSRFWPVVHVGIPAVALAAMLIAAFALWRDVPGVAPARDVLAARSMTVEWIQLRPSATATEISSADVVVSLAPRTNAPARTAGIGSPTVLISSSEAAALRELFAGRVGFAIASDIVQIAAEQPAPAAEPSAPAPEPTSDIAITPISIDPIAVGSLAEGKQP